MLVQEPKQVETTILLDRRTRDHLPSFLDVVPRSCANHHIETIMVGEIQGSHLPEAKLQVAAQYPRLETIYLELAGNLHTPRQHAPLLRRLQQVFEEIFGRLKAGTSCMCISNHRNKDCFDSVVVLSILP